jgi:N-acetylglucosamine-6-phosphate deacetylase
MRLIAGLVAVIGAAVALAAQSSSGPSNEPLALINANVVNVRDGRVLSGATVVLRNGRIDSINTSPAPAGIKALDLKGKYLLPA